jgi:hypothetical protein
MARSAERKIKPRDANGVAFLIFSALHATAQNTRRPAHFATPRSGNPQARNATLGANRVETAVDITRESLHQRYSDLTDAELLRRARSGALTELAREVALAELAERGISLEDVVEPPPALQATIEFPADEFERNPYQAPRIAVDAPREASARPEALVSKWLWWIYAAVVSTFSLFVAYFFLRKRPDAETVIILSIYGWQILGLVGWRLRRRWLHENVWVAALAVNAVLQYMLIEALIHAVRYEPSGFSHREMIFRAAGNVLLSLPLSWALLSYAFLSPSIWRTRSRN